MNELETLKGAIEYAPKEPGPIAKDLQGWVTPGGLFVCSHCAGRIIARGLDVPRGSEPSWVGVTPPPACCLHIAPPAPITGRLIRVGQVWTSPDTGNRWEIIGLMLPAEEGDGKVNVKRLPRKGQRRLPKWEGEALYCFHASQFRVMEMESDRPPI